MEELLILIIETIGEALITVILEVFGHFLCYFLPTKKDSTYYKFFHAWGYASIGIILGIISLIIFPSYLLKPPSHKVLNLILSPIVIGLFMGRWGKRRKKKGKKDIELDNFVYGYLFALMVSLTRLVFAK